MSTFGNGDGLHDRAEDMRDTLAIVNVVRAAFNEEPLEALPTAVTGNAAECLYARAFGSISKADVGAGGHITFENNERGRRAAMLIARLTGGDQTSENTVQTPAVFKRVISAFDHKEFKEFNDPASYH